MDQNMKDTSFTIDPIYLNFKIKSLNCIPPSLCCVTFMS